MDGDEEVEVEEDEERLTDDDDDAATCSAKTSSDNLGSAICKHPYQSMQERQDKDEDKDRTKDEPAVAKTGSATMCAQAFGLGR